MFARCAVIGDYLASYSQAQRQQYFQVGQDRLVGLATYCDKVKSSTILVYNKNMTF